MDLLDKKSLDNILYIGAIITGLLAARQGLKGWLKYEIAVSFIFTLVSYLKPELIWSELLNVPMKNEHKYFAALDGSYLSFSVLFPLFFMNTKDESIFYWHLWGRTLVSLNGFKLKYIYIE
jgi:hypothetical protein